MAYRPSSSKKHGNIFCNIKNIVIQDFKFTNFAHLQIINAEIASTNANTAQPTPAIMPALNSTVECFIYSCNLSQLVCMNTSFASDTLPCSNRPVYLLTEAPLISTLYTILVVTF